MGMMIDGAWVHSGWEKTADEAGTFVRKPVTFRGHIGPGALPAESGRYHLYVSLACPWAHRTLIYRRLKQLESHISVTVVDPIMLEEGWVFSSADPDPLGHTFLREIYGASDPHFTGRVTVPILWDTHTGSIVNNESSEIIRMFNSQFDALTGDRQDFYPEALREQIDAWNARIYDTLNNGVYRCGFATTQSAYDDAVQRLFATMAALETRLSESRYLCGDRLTEADLRLFPTLARFDPVYVGHFKCNLYRLVDLPNLWAFARDVYQHPGVAETVDFHHIKEHYHRSHASVNPHGIVPAGPVLDWNAPHGRG